MKFRGFYEKLCKVRGFFSVERTVKCQNGGEGSVVGIFSCLDEGSRFCDSGSNKGSRGRYLIFYLIFRFIMQGRCRLGRIMA